MTTVVVIDENAYVGMNSLQINKIFHSYETVTRFYAEKVLLYLLLSFEII